MPPLATVPPADDVALLRDTWASAGRQVARMQLARSDVARRRRLLGSLVARCVAALRTTTDAGGPAPEPHLEELRRAWLRGLPRGAGPHRHAEIENAIRTVRAGLGEAPVLPPRHDTQLVADLLDLDHALHRAIRRLPH